MRWCHRPAALAAELLRFRNAFFRFSRCWHLRTTLIVFKAHFYRVMRQGLEPVADTPVGSDAMLGISSSQRRQTTTGEGTVCYCALAPQVERWRCRDFGAGRAPIRAAGLDKISGFRIFRAAHFNSARAIERQRHGLTKSVHYYCLLRSNRLTACGLPGCCRRCSPGSSCSSGAISPCTVSGEALH